MAKKKKGDENYNRMKEFKGSKYSGMKVGARHKWYYDQGEWREQKITPEEWDIYYETVKRRAGKAPEGSGAPVGTAYNWLIVAHQRVDKIDANSYTTSLNGKKFKVAHKRATKDKWNITEKTQRKKVVQFLEEVIQDLKSADENDDIPYTVGEHNNTYWLEHQTKTELYQLAVEQSIPNRSKMSHEELLEAIKSNMDGQPDTQKVEAPQKPSAKRKKESYNRARKKSIKARSEMKLEK